MEEFDIGSSELLLPFNSSVDIFLFNFPSARFGWNFCKVSLGVCEHPNETLSPRLEVLAIDYHGVVIYVAQLGVYVFVWGAMLDLL